MDNAPLTKYRYLGALSKIDWRIYSAVCWQYIAFFEHSIIKNTSSPRCAMKMIFEKQKKTNLKKIADIRFFVCDCLTYMFPLYKYSLTWKFTEYCISKPSQKNFFWCAYIFFATIYSYLLYFLCMVRNKDFFAILFGYSTTI